MDTTSLIQLPDGTWAVLNRSMDWGQVVIILLLVAMLVLQVFSLWQRRG
jgi:hypothetical protein